MKNKLVVVGWLGVKKCYLNVPREEAIDRYVKSELAGYETPEQIQKMRKDVAAMWTEEFEFDDEFSAYDAWADN